eukprot:Skav200493  [mRNA]  locus=scaffold450:254924:262897:+ [translate_table: standard]
MQCRWSSTTPPNPGSSAAFLADALRRDSDWQVRKTAAKALGALGAASKVDELLAALGDASCQALEDALLDEAWQAVHLFAWAKIHKHQNPRRSDSDSRVREEAAKSLAAIGKQRSQSSARQLGESADLSSCADALAAALQDEEIRVRSAAIAALGSQAVAAREHASSLVEQLLTGDHATRFKESKQDIRAAVFRFFQEATSHAGTRLLAAAFDDGKHHQVRPEVEEIMAWSKAIARPVLRVAQDLRAASHEAMVLGPVDGDGWAWLGTLQSVISGCCPQQQEIAL